MSPQFLLDENLRGPLWDAIDRHNQLRNVRIDALRLGDEGTPPLGSIDPDILIWCAAAGRILVSVDKQTLPGHLADHLAAGLHSPGLFLIRPEQSIRAVVQFLALASVASDAAEWRDAFTYIP
jgi:hypothetical protein